MIRKKSKMVRKRRQEILTVLPITRNKGGCVPRVGNDCLKEQLRFVDMGTIWIDSGVCHDCSNKPCKYYTEWKRMLKDGEL